MNFQYTDPNQPQPQQQPFGGYILQINPNQPQPQQQADYPPITKEMVEDMHYLRMRQQIAQIRLAEQRLLLEGLHEIRSALDTNSLTVAEGDTGSKDRPPLEAAFNAVNRTRLQAAYLRMTERVVNYCEHCLREDKVKMTNEIKKKV